MSNTPSRLKRNPWSKSWNVFTRWAKSSKRLNTEQLVWLDDLAIELEVSGRIGPPDDAWFETKIGDTLHMAWWIKDKNGVEKAFTAAIYPLGMEKFDINLFHLHSRGMPF